MRTALIIMLVALVMLVSGCYSTRSYYRSPYATQGQYLGQLSANPYAPNSTSNPYGPYGNPYSPLSINNPYGPYGNPYSPLSPRNPYGQGIGIWGRQ